jgi:hypothetical protein
MTTHEPYNFKISGSNKYIFETETDILYSVEFTEGSYYFHRLPEYIYVFELSINILRVDENISPLNDKRVNGQRRRYLFKQNSTLQYKTLEINKLTIKCPQFLYPQTVKKNKVQP